MRDKSVTSRLELLALANHIPFDRGDRGLWVRDYRKSQSENFVYGGNTATAVHFVGDFVGVIQSDFVMLRVLFPVRSRCSACKASCFVTRFVILFHLQNGRSVCRFTREGCG